MSFIVAGFTPLRERPLVNDPLAKTYLVQDEASRESLLTIGNHPAPSIHLRTYLSWVESVKHASGNRHVADVLSAGVTPEGLVYLVTATGLAILADNLHRFGPYAVAQTLRLGVCMADGLAAVHLAGLAHGAVRPSTIQANSDGSALLAGFNSLVPTISMPIGADSYTAPELHSLAEQGKIAASPAADVYALATTIWVTMGGRLPWATDPMDLTRRAAPLPFTAHIPPDVVTCLRAATSLQPAARPTAMALREALVARAVEVRQQQPADIGASDAKFEFGLLEGAGVRVIGKRRIPAGKSVVTNISLGRAHGLVGMLSTDSRKALETLSQNTDHTAVPKPVPKAEDAATVTGGEPENEHSWATLRNMLLTHAAIPTAGNLLATYLVLMATGQPKSSAVFMTGIFLAVLTGFVLLKWAMERRGRRMPSTYKLVVAGSAGYSIATTSTAMIITDFPVVLGIFLLLTTAIIAAVSFTLGLITPHLLGASRDQLLHQISTAALSIAVGIPAAAVGEGVTHPTGELEGVWRSVTIPYAEQVGMEGKGVDGGTVRLVREDGCVGARCAHVGEGDLFNTLRFVRQPDGAYTSQYSSTGNCIEAGSPNKVLAANGYVNSNVVSLRSAGQDSNGLRLLEITITGVGTPTAEASKQNCKESSFTARGTAVEVR